MFPHQILTAFAHTLLRMRILVVEDDPDIASGIELALRRAGYIIDVRRDGLEGERTAFENPYGLIVLDLMLPTKDGFAICRSLRKHGKDVPILMLTARDAVADRVNGLDAGADDYLVKPFAIDELLARVRALTRRKSDQRGSLIEIGNLVLDTIGKTVTGPDGLIHLTKREYDLLEALARNKDRVLSRETILDRVWNADEALPNTVNFHMASLRKKVDPDGVLIETVHGFGYTIRTRAGKDL